MILAISTLCYETFNDALADISHKVLTGLPRAERGGLISWHLDSCRNETAILCELTDIGCSLEVPVAAPWRWVKPAGITPRRLSAVGPSEPRDVRRPACNALLHFRLGQLPFRREIPTANQVAVAAVIIVIGTWEPNLQIADAGSAPTRPSLIGPRLTENNGSNLR